MTKVTTEASAYDYIAEKRYTLEKLGLTLDSTEAEIETAAYAIEFDAEVWDNLTLTQTIPAIRDLIIRAESKGYRA